MKTNVIAEPLKKYTVIATRIFLTLALMVGHRYYLEILGHKPVEMQNSIVDPDRKTVTDQLMVVCEDTSCSPLGYSLFEVAGFGRAEIAGSWDGPHVKVFRLVHYHGK